MIQIKLFFIKPWYIKHRKTKINQERTVDIMANKQRFNDAAAKHLKTLGQYVPIVDKVHGKSHPEFHDVHAAFNALAEKISKAGFETPDLNEEFAKLREITNSYTVPDDVCESYEAVYNMLCELDQAYQEKD